MELRNGNFNRGFETLVCDEALHEEAHPSRGQSNKKQVSLFTVKPGRCYRLAVVSLALLAVVLLMLNIGLGVHYDKLTDTHLTLDDTERISKELADLQDTYKAAVETMKDARKQLDSETSRQKQTNWELEHQTKRSNDYKSQIETITKEIETMRSHLLMTSDGCKHCPAGWILMNSVCYYFPFSNNGYKTWKASRDFCQLHGGDLIIIDSKDEENSAVNYLITHKAAVRLTRDLMEVHSSSQHFTPMTDHDFIDWMSRRRWVNRPMRRQEPSQNLVGFWIGLRDLHEEGTWKWWDGTLLDEGYWNDGEPNDIGNEDCAAVYPRENFFKAWNDVKCDAEMKWICEKAPTSMS